MKTAYILLVSVFVTLSVTAQKITKLTITDNLSASSRFSYGKPKPAAPKDHFYLLTDKGTQVLFFAELSPEDSASTSSRSLRFTAYKSDAGKDVWVDDRTIDVKAGGTYVMTAFNFNEIGNFKIVITPEGSETVLSKGTFVITK